ncbi:MAG: hypothetical protein ACKVRP_09630 [Bacteroidota bacterium]
MSERFILAGSDSVFLDSLLLIRDKDYRLDYKGGAFRIDSSFARQYYSLDSSRKNLELRIGYSALPFRFQPSYARRKLIVLQDSSRSDTIRVARPSRSIGLDDIFGSNLQKSGSIVRGLTVGSNRDLSLNSGFRMQLAGKITSDIEVAASLTDENTPIQPEGTTQTLQEFDKVFVEIKGTDYAATLGDFNLEMNGTEFSRFSRKLQGAKGDAQFRGGGTNGAVMLSGASPRGKYATNQFQGLEGVQGPYRLSGRNSERDIIVIAGTEKVFINGQQQTRGETNDYTVDYSTSELRFTARRLITSASRITVDFEYTDRKFSRSLLAGGTTASFWSNKATLGFSFLRETDNPDAPVDAELSDSARTILQSAGDDASKAKVTGVTQVDSNGLYFPVDTVLSAGDSVRFYRYAPGNPAAIYVISFTYVGFGKGEYIRRAAGEFEWQGPAGGDYLPIRFLPFAQLQQIIDVTLGLTPVEDLNISGEFARSQFDANRFSTIDDGDNGGHALNFVAGYAPKELTIGGTNIGAVSVKLRERFVDGKFVPIDRANDIEFNRKWGIDSLQTADEEIQEASVGYMPSAGLSFDGGYGKITRGEQFRSVRNEGRFSLNQVDLPRANYFIESVRSRERLLDNSSSWLRHNGSLSYGFWKFTPSFRIEGEDRSIRSLSSDTLKNGSFRYSTYAPGLALAGIGPVSLSSEFEWRTDDIFSAGTRVRESKSFTQAYAANLREWNSVSSSTEITLRRKEHSPLFKVSGNPDIRSVLVRNQTRYSPLNRGIETDVFYQVTTERSSRLERVFLRVSEGTGNYQYLGDLNNNGIAEESEFELTRFEGDFIAISLPSDELFPVIDLKTSIRFKISPRRFVEAGDGLISDISRIITSETYARVEEKSTEADLKQIYLLHLRRFRSDSTTIIGSTLFTEDLTFFEGEPGFSGKLRFSERKGLTRLSSGVERSFTRERSVRIRWQLLEEVSNQIDYVNRIDAVSTNESSSRIRDILSNGLTFDLSYRPEQNIEFGLKLDISEASDRYQTPAFGADLNAQTVRFVYSFQGAGQARIEAAREEVLLQRSAVTFPFELTGGRVEGKTWLWRVAFDYRVTQFIQATVNYDGRSEGARSPVHTARAEVRAFF